MIDKLSPGYYNLAIERSIRDENFDVLVELLQGQRPIENILRLLNIAIFKNNPKIVWLLLNTNIQSTILAQLSYNNPMIDAL